MTAVSTRSHKINFPNNNTSLTTEANESSYYLNDNVLEDSRYLNDRDNIYPGFVVDIDRDGGALRIRNTDVAVIYNPNDPAQTYQDLSDAVIGLDKEYSEDPKLWQFTQRDLRWKVKQIYNNEEIKEEQKKEETKRETKVRELAEELERKYHFAAIEDTEELLYYNRKVGVYDPATTLVKAQLEKMQPGIITDTVTNVIQKLARRHLYKREKFDADKNIINMENGLYDIAKGELMSHTHEYLSRNQIPVRFDPKARCKRFGQFLGEVVYPQQVRTVLEMMAYTLLRDNPFELYALLVGVGANGKSVLMYVLTALHGEDNVSNTPLTLLISNRFAKKELEGKNVNIDMEMSNASVTDMSVLKELTGQQPVRIEPKHLPAYTTRLWAKHFFSTNEMPEMLDFTDGHYRREVLISFPYSFEEVQTELEKNSIKAMMADSNRRIADPHLKHTLTTPEELSGIFNVLMVPLRNRIMQNKPVYVDARTIEERRLRHELFSDPIGVFFREATEGDVEAKVPKELVYNAYRRFCKHYRLPVESYDHFCKLVKKKFPIEVAEGRDSGEGRKRVWKGFTLVKWNFVDSMQDILTP